MLPLLDFSLALTLSSFRLLRLYGLMLATLFILRPPQLLGLLTTLMLFCLLPLLHFHLLLLLDLSLALALSSFRLLRLNRLMLAPLFILQPPLLFGLLALLVVLHLAFLLTRLTRSLRLPRLILNLLSEIRLSLPLLLNRFNLCLRVVAPAAKVLFVSSRTLVTTGFSWFCYGLFSWRPLSFTRRSDLLFRLFIYPAVAQTLPRSRRLLRLIGLPWLDCFRLPWGRSLVLAVSG